FLPLFILRDSFSLPCARSLSLYFFFSSYGHHRDLHSFPTRRSSDLWGYFAAPGAMRRLAPPFMPLRPHREADSLRDGVAVLVPRSALPGPRGARLGPAWAATRDPAAYVDGERFVDRCTSQPYAGLTGWVHEHTVTAGPDGTTVLGDRVDA